MSEPADPRLATVGHSHRPRRLRGSVRPARHADPERGRRPARGPPRRDRPRLRRAARGARRARPRGGDRVPDPDRGPAGAEVTADAARPRRWRASTSSPQEAAEELLARLLEYRRFRAASEWMHERLAAEQGYRYRAAPLPPELRRVTLEAAGKVYEPQRLADADRGPAAHAAAGRHQPHDAGHRVARAPARAPARPARARGRRSRSTTRSAESDRMTQAVTLFALLELYKSGELVWRQRENFGPIEIMAKAETERESHRPTGDRAAVLLTRAGEPRRPVRGARMCRAAPRRCGRAAARALRAGRGGHRAARGRRRAHARVRPRGRRRRAPPALQAAHAAALAGAGRVPGDRRLPAAGGAPGDRAHPRA